VLHALGFTDSLFGAYIDPNTFEVRGEDAVRQVKTAENREVRRERCIELRQSEEHAAAMCTHIQV